MPSYWLMNYPYNKQVDIIINELLDKYEFSDLDKPKHTCKLGGVTIWTANIPYAFGTLYKHELSELRPSRLTIKKLLKRFYEYREKVQIDYRNKTLSKVEL